MLDSVRQLLYAAAVSEEALARQLGLGRMRFRCCWSRREDGHHGLCPIGRRKRRR